MHKLMVLLLAVLSGSCCARQPADVQNHKTLYPFLGKNGLYGYVDIDFQIHIQPQYTRVYYFNSKGYAVVKDSSADYGVIDQDNHIVVPFVYKNIDLFDLSDFTLIETRESYHSNLRFWEWKFLPGLNLLGGGSSDKRLFDTKVERQKTTLGILGNKNRNIASKTTTSSSSFGNYFKIIPLDSNQLLVDGNLYAVHKNGAKRLASGVMEQTENNCFVQQRAGALRVIDSRGKPVSDQIYKPLDSLEFKVVDTPVWVHLPPYQKAYIAYRDAKGKAFIYPEFSKPLPRLINDNMQANDLAAEDILRKTSFIASIPQSDYFLFMGHQDKQPFYRFLDTDGNWHQTLPKEIPFTVVTHSGSILWPAEDYYIKPEEVPQGWKIHKIKQLRENHLYNITIQKDKDTRQGIWDFDKKKWLISPLHYLIYRLGENGQQWAFQPQKGSPWGVLDGHGKVLIKPAYQSISSDGWVQLQENGNYISFYLHLPTLRELREK